MTIQLTDAQAGAVGSAVIAAFGWLLIQWRSAVKDNRDLHKNFYKLVSDETTKVAASFDIEIENLQERVGNIRRNVSTLAKELGDFQKKPSIRILEYERVATDLREMEMEVDAVTARLRELQRKKGATKTILEELISGTFDHSKYEASRSKFQSSVKEVQIVRHTLPQTDRLLLGMSTSDKDTQIKLRDLETQLQTIKSKVSAATGK